MIKYTANQLAAVFYITYHTAYKTISYFKKTFSILLYAHTEQKTLQQANIHHHEVSYQIVRSEILSDRFLSRAAADSPYTLLRNGLIQRKGKLSLSPNNIEYCPFLISGQHKRTCERALSATFPPADPTTFLVQCTRKG